MIKQLNIIQMQQSTILKIIKHSVTWVKYIKKLGNLHKLEIVIIKLYLQIPSIRLLYTI